MNIILCGGTGLIGSELINAEILSDIRWTVLTRKKIDQTKQHTENHRVRYLTYDDFFAQETGEQEFDGLINLAGAPISQFPWTKKRKENIYSSRVNFTQQLIQSITSMGLDLKFWINASAVGIYGTHSSSSPFFTEESLTGKDDSFLCKVCTDWENSVLTSPLPEKCRKVILRFGVVCSTRGGALPLWIKQVKFFTGFIPGEGNQPVSWIALKEVPHILRFILDHPDLTGAINVVSPKVITMKYLMKTIARNMNRPLLIKIPAGILKFFMGDFGKEMLLSGQATIPQKLLNAGYPFLYDDFELFLRTEIFR